MSDPREVLRRLREAHAKAPTTQRGCGLDGNARLAIDWSRDSSYRLARQMYAALPALLEVAEAVAEGNCSDCSTFRHTESCQRIRAALARLGEE